MFSPSLHSHHIATIHKIVGFILRREGVRSRAAHLDPLSRALERSCGHLVGGMCDSAELYEGNEHCQ